jgi:hypothetical protein
VPGLITEDTIEHQYFFAKIVRMACKLCAGCIAHNAGGFCDLISDPIEHFALDTGLWAHLPCQRMMIKDDAFTVVCV